MPIIHLPMEFHIAQGDAKMGDRQRGIEGLTAEMVERVGVRGAITPLPATRGGDANRTAARCRC
jgi:hypothetical protein